MYVCVFMYESFEPYLDFWLVAMYVASVFFRFTRWFIIYTELLFIIIISVLYRLSLQCMWISIAIYIYIISCSTFNYPLAN